MSAKQPGFIARYVTHDFRLCAIKAGLSNHNFYLQLLSPPNTEYFVREFGQDYQSFGNDPEREAQLQTKAVGLGLAPKVHYVCSEGMITDWVVGRHLVENEWKDPNNVHCLAQLLAKLHSQNIKEYELDLKQQLTHYFDIIEPAFKTERLWQQLDVCYHIIEHKLVSERQGFCHHDLNPTNFMMHNDGRWYLLDWEFAAQGHCDFDLATLLQTLPWSDTDIEYFLLCYNEAMQLLNTKHVRVVDEQLQYMLVIVEMVTLLWAIIMHQSQPTAGYLPIWKNAANALTLQLNKIKKY